MLACQVIGPVRVCSGSQLTNVNATAKAKFVDSAIGPDVMLGGHARAPRVLRVMAQSVVALPSSDDEVVFPWNLHFSL